MIIPKPTLAAKMQLATLTAETARNGGSARGGGQHFEPSQKSPGPPVAAQGRAETRGEAQIAFHLASWLR